MMAVEPDELGSPEALAAQIAERLGALAREAHDADDPSISPAINEMKDRLLAGARRFGGAEMATALADALRPACRKARSWSELRAKLSPTGWPAWLSHYLCMLGRRIFCSDDWFEVSRPLFRAAVSLNVTQAEATFYLALHDLARHGTKSAVARLRKPRLCPQCRHPLAGVLVEMVRARDRGRLGDIGERIRRATSPLPPAELIPFAYALKIVNQTDLASALIDNAIVPRAGELDPNERGCYAFVLEQTERRDEAIEQFTLVPDEDAATAVSRRLRIGILHYEMGRWQATLDAFSKMRAFGPDTKASLLYTALSRLRLGDWGGAMSTLRDRPDTIPMDGDWLLADAAVLATEGDEDWTAPLDRIDPTDELHSEPGRLLAWAAEKAGRDSDLERWCGRGTGTPHRHVRYWLWRTRFEQERWEDAARMLEADRRADDGDPYFDLCLATTALRLGNGAATLAYVRSASPPPEDLPDWLMIEAGALALAGDERWLDPLARLPSDEEAYVESCQALVWAVRRAGVVPKLEDWTRNGNDVHRRDLARLMRENNH